MNEPYLTCELVSLNEQLSKFSFPKDFKCGSPLLDKFVNKGGLKRALQSENVDATGLIADGHFAGYLTIKLGELDRARVKTFLKPPTNQPPQIPVVKILMIAVDERFQKLGMGTMLMAESFKKAIAVHKTVPIKGVYLDAAPGKVKYYEYFGFQALDEPGSDGTTPMFIAMAEVLDAMAEAQDGGS